MVAAVTTATETSAQAVVPPGVRSGKLRAKRRLRAALERQQGAVAIRPHKSLRSSGPLRLSDAQVSPNKVLFGGRNADAQLRRVKRDARQRSAGRHRLHQRTGDAEHLPDRSATEHDPDHALERDRIRRQAGAGRLVRVQGLERRRQPDAARPHVRRRRGSSASPCSAAIFPVRGPHDFGSAGARFGAARAGHTHQGQDILAACGTKLVAARGGTVQYAGYQGAAGNYIVIDQKGSGEDNIYMHLVAPSPLHTGDKVATGQ